MRSEAQRHWKVTRLCRFKGRNEVEEDRGRCLTNGVGFVDGVVPMDEFSSFRCLTPLSVGTRNVAPTVSL
jgi:hypothetical protein